MEANLLADASKAARLPDGAPLDYAPSNEQAVVFLFSHLAYWPELRRIVLARNPQAERALRAYGPERVQ